MTEKEQIWELAERIFVQRVTNPKPMQAVKLATMVKESKQQAEEFILQKTMDFADEEEENG
jgi:hypothetical protein